MNKNSDIPQENVTDAGKSLAQSMLARHYEPIVEELARRADKLKALIDDKLENLSFHPMPFASTNDVVALLNRTKVVTRRIIKDQSVLDNIAFFTGTVDGENDDANLLVHTHSIDNHSLFQHPSSVIISHNDYPNDHIIEVNCDLGGVGEFLYVQEPWKVGAWRDDGRIAIDYLASPEQTNTPWIYPSQQQFKQLTNKAFKDCERVGTPKDARGCYVWQAGQSPCEIQLAKTMPKWASRIILKITSLSIQRLQDMTEEDAIAEGIGSSLLRDCKLPKFINHWNELHNDQSSWDDNPWVWVIGFELIEFNQSV